MAAQEEMTREKNKAEPKPKGRRANLTEVFDLLDDVWGYIEKCEARNRFIGRAFNEDVKNIRSRMEPMRELLHGNPKNDPAD